MRESESEVTQSCPTLSDPMDCSLPGSSIHGIFQARVLEWVVIAFSENAATVPYINLGSYPQLSLFAGLQRMLGAVNGLKYHYVPYGNLGSHSQLLISSF